MEWGGMILVFWKGYKKPNKNVWCGVWRGDVLVCCSMLWCAAVCCVVLGALRRRLT
jgi:hypothetical protein